MLVFISSTPEELAPYQAAAGDAVRELDMDLLLRDPDGLPGFKPVGACVHQAAAADVVLAIVGHRRGAAPAPEHGGDGLHPWSWWETRAAFERGLGVEVFMAADSWRPELREDDASARAVMRDFRGELGRLATLFDDDPDDGFRQLVRRRFLARQAAHQPAPASAATELPLRRWPPPKLPARPYPVLLPYAHPDLLAGRDRELARLRQLLARPVPILGLHAPSGTGKTSLLYGGLVQGLRADGRPVAFDRHPCEPGIARRLLGDLLEKDTEVDDDEPHAFVDRLRAFPTLPILILDQFEDLLRRADAGRARAVVGTLLAASAQRQAGLRGPPCRWLLAYRQEFHGEVFQWLSDVLRDARKEGGGSESLPHDLSSADRFHAWPLAPLGTPAPGTDDRVEAAAGIFQAAIEKPLQLTSAAGTPLYPWRFAEGSAARLARAFGEARAAQRTAPLAPEFQVVLAHLLETSWTSGDDGVKVVEVPEDPGQLIDRALEEHLRRALEVVFPAGKKAAARIARTRALLALRELADAQGQRDEGRSIAALARAIGREGQQVLEKLATPQTRLVLLERHGDDQVYVLAHDRLAEVLVRVVDEGLWAGLGIDAELLGLRRFVALQNRLYAAGDVEQATAVPSGYFGKIEAHQEVLLWHDRQRAWWQACRTRRRLERRRNVVRRTVAAVVLALVAFGAWTVADRRARRRALLEEIAAGEPEVAFAALDQLTRSAGYDPSRDRPEELLDRLRERENPFDIFERGLGGVDEDRRAEVLLRVAELALPILEASPGGRTPEGRTPEGRTPEGRTPEDPVLIASLVWALDFFAGPDPAFTERASALRDEVLGPLRRSRPPPPMPGPGTPAAGDPHWADIPAGTFWMGAGPEDGRDSPNMQDEKPRHQVTLSAFRMMTHEVTNAEYRRLFPDHQGADDLPAASMTWYEAYTYAAWLGGRLPTESEWEYVARAGCAHAYCQRDGSEATRDEVAWWVGNSADPETGEPSVKPVMQLEPNPWGLWDVYGNVQEWNASWFNAYSEVLERDPPGPTGTSLDYRSYRGASFFRPKEWILASGRGGDTPDIRGNSLGLRVVIGESEDR